MKKIILKRMELINFKGARQVAAEFGEGATTIRGRNGCGKTTLFDAFTWVLFGKDSRDRKAFDIKTLGSDGKAMAKLPHEATAIIEVDGAEISLTRRYNEKWVKRRGSAAEEFAGHEEERLYNNVPCSLKEWNEKIAAVCPEEAFKMATSPAYFTSMKPDAQRAVLMKMCGGFSDNEVVAASGQREDFIELLGKLCGKTMEEYKREIAAKKRIIKAELDALPERIDERQRDIEGCAAVDYAQAERELAEKEGALAKVEGQLEQASEIVSAARCAREKLASELSRVKDGLLRIEADARQNAGQAYYAAKRRQEELRQTTACSQAEEKMLGPRIAELRNAVQRMKERRAELIAERGRLKAMRLECGADLYTCPTCGQPLDPEGIEKKRAEMEAAFNARKSQALQDNMEQGQKCSRTLIEEAEASLAQLEREREALARKIEQGKAELEATPALSEPTAEDAAREAERHPEYAALKREEARLAAELDKPMEGCLDTRELQEGRKLLAEGIAQLKAVLEGRAYKERNEARIRELEAQLRAQSEELARLEGVEFTIAEFGKARVEACEAKIAAMFKLVRFRMYETQINGGEVETCEATVGGVPYGSLNNAMRINAGLDIINALCRWQGICAPIFIDNCESVLEPLETEGQQIRLIVADQDMEIRREE